MSRNPKWTRDELILALDLYFQVSPSNTSQSNPQIVELSDLLNRLPIHARQDADEKFRNPNGVYMKMCNFLRLDSSYSGTGLGSGAKLDEVVWDEFAGDRLGLARVAKAIRENASSLAPPASVEEEQSQEAEEFPEGRIVARIHKARERSSTAVKKKKKAVLEKKGVLDCEVCKFSFVEKYGELGVGFCECHHNKPVSELLPDEKTRLDDLSIVCANCHRMIHRIRPWLTVEELKNRLAGEEDNI